MSKLTPKKAASLVEAGRLDLERGDFPAAIDKLEQSIGILKEPDLRMALAQAHALHGARLLSDGLLSGARSHLERSWELKSDLPGLAGPLSRVRWANQDLDGTSKALEARLVESPGETSVLLALCLVRIRQGHVDAALKLMAKCTAGGSKPLSPPLDQTLSLLEVLLAHCLPDQSHLNNMCDDAPNAEGPTLSPALVRSLQMLAQSFAADAENTTREVLNLYGAQALGGPPADLPEGMLYPPPLLDQLQSALGPVIASLAEAGRAALESGKNDPHAWVRILARDARALTKEEARIPAFSELADNAPLGLRAMLEVVMQLDTADPTSAVTGLMRAENIPILAAVALMEAILERIDPATTSLSLLRGLSSQPASLPVHLRGRFADALFSRGDVATAELVYASMERRTTRQDRARALGLEWVGRETEATEVWLTLLPPLVDSPPTPLPLWLGPGVAHLARLLTATGRMDELGKLLQRAVSSLAGEFDVQAAWLRYLHAEKKTDDLQRFIHALRRSKASAAYKPYLLAWALFLTDQAQQAGEVLVAHLQDARPAPLARRLFDDIVRNRSLSAGSPASALAILEEAATVRPPSPWMIFIEASIRETIQPAEGAEQRTAASAAARRDPESAMKIALSLLSREETSSSLAVLSDIELSGDLPPALAANVTAGLMAIGAQEAARNWLMAQLGGQQRDDERLAFLALLFVDLYDSYGSKEMAINVIRVAEKLDPLDQRLKAALMTFQDPATAADAAATQRALSHLRAFAKCHREDALLMRYPPFWDPFTLLGVPWGTDSAAVAAAGSMLETRGVSPEEKAAIQYLLDPHGHREALLFTLEPAGAESHKVRPAVDIFRFVLAQLIARDLGLDPAGH